MKEFPKNIAIIGIGLIGGSISLGLKQHFGHKIKIFGTCRTLHRSEQAKNEGIIDEIYDLENPHPKVNFFIVATPILQIPPVLKKLAAKIKTKSIILDVGSTKAFIAEKAAGILPAHLSFIGTHPMAGSDASGFENADPNLFRNKPWIVCNRQSTIINELLTILGAKIAVLDSKTHDKLTSWASHLNLVSSSIITNLIAKQTNWPQIAKIASTGFRDSTRLASLKVEVKKDIILTNKANITEALLKLRQETDFFINLLNDGNDTKITNYLSHAKKIRDDWLVNYFS